MSAKDRGFTLIELIIGLSLSVFVLIAIVSLAASVIRYQYEGIRKGEVTGQTLFALSQMQRELENATYLELPTLVSPGDLLSGCTNWSKQLSPSTGGLAIDPDPSVPVMSFYYCVKWEVVDGINKGTLWRYQGNSCPIAGAHRPQGGGCGNAPANPPLGVIHNAVIYRNFYKMDGTDYVFKRADDVGGVEMHYIVGNATPTVNTPTPVYYKFDVKVGMNKAYGNTVD